jgi:hypothetical protein
MDANTIVDFSNRTGDKKKEMTVGPILDGGRTNFHLSYSKEGNSICFTDYYGKSISVTVKLPRNEPVEGVMNRDALTSNGSAPCNCFPFAMGGMQALVYFDDTGHLRFCDHH